MLRTVALLLNLVVSIISAGWGVVALARPATLSRSLEISGGERFYVGMYAARAIPFEFASGLLPFFFVGRPFCGFFRPLLSFSFWTSPSHSGGEIAR